MFRAIGGVCLAFGETLVCVWRRCLFPVHGVIVTRVLRRSIHPSLLIDDGGELHVFDGITHFYFC